MRSVARSAGSTAGRSRVTSSSISCPAHPFTEFESTRCAKTSRTVHLSCHSQRRCGSRGAGLTSRVVDLPDPVFSDHDSARRTGLGHARWRCSRDEAAASGKNATTRRLRVIEPIVPALQNLSIVLRFVQPMLLPHQLWRHLQDAPRTPARFLQRGLWSGRRHLCRSESVVLAVDWKGIAWPARPDSVDHVPQAPPRSVRLFRAAIRWPQVEYGFVSIHRQAYATTSSLLLRQSPTRHQGLARRLLFEGRPGERPGSLAEGGRTPAAARDGEERRR
jgi:hypothetical protein